jgi:hypothetical protein
MNTTGETTLAHYTQYFDYHVGLLKKFKDSIQKYPPYHTSLADLTETDTAVMATLDELCQHDHYNEEMMERGQWLIERIVSGYNQLMPFLSRDLLWFFGGDSLHYMPDDEIRFYQQLDELRYAAESQDRPFDIEEAKDYLMQQNQSQ